MAPFTSLSILLHVAVITVYVSRTVLGAPCPWIGLEPGAPEKADADVGVRTLPARAIDGNVMKQLVGGIRGRRALLQGAPPVPPNTSAAGAPNSVQLPTLLALGKQWKISSWNASSPCIDWKGLTCDNNGNAIKMQLSNAGLTGPFPEILATLTTLTHIDFSYNQLTGGIPTSIGQLGKLVSFILSVGYLHGPIPESVGRLTTLSSMDLSGNIFSGNIPSSFGNLTSLTSLLLGSNSLLGSIPSSMGDMTLLNSLDMSKNNLTGSIPSSFGNLTSLSELYLNNNGLSGSIPTTLTGCVNLHSFYVDFNYVTGVVPTALQTLQQEGFSSNCFTNLTGQRSPAQCSSFCDCVNPECACGASGTCSLMDSGSACSIGAVASPPPPQSPSGAPMATSSPSNNGTLYIVVGVAVAVVLLLCVIGVFIWYKMRKDKKHSSSTKDAGGPTEDYFLPNGLGGFIPLRVLTAATNNFDEANVLGEGGFGKVYKGVTTEGGVWAVKRSKYVAKGAKMVFEVEVEAVSQMHHANLTTLIGYCDEKGEEILVYEYVPCGTLEENLHPKRDSHYEKVDMTFHDRLKIARGAAEGLLYLHTFANPPIVHRDIKPANVLLGENFNVKVADFGLLKHNEGMGMAMTTKVQGTYGYIDPDYYKSNKVTTKSDVYSFGVLLFELMTGRRPVLPDPREEGEFMHITEWVQPLLNSHDLATLKDPRMKGAVPPNELLQYLNVASLCVQKNSNDRPEMREVSFRLTSIGMEIRGVHSDTDGASVSGESHRMFPFYDEIREVAHQGSNTDVMWTSNEEDRVLAPSIGFRGVR